MCRSLLYIRIYIRFYTTVYVFLFCVYVQVSFDKRDPHIETNRKFVFVSMCTSLFMYTCIYIRFYTYVRVMLSTLLTLLYTITITFVLTLLHTILSHFYSHYYRPWLTYSCPHDLIQFCLYVQVSFDMTYLSIRSCTSLRSHCSQYYISILLHSCSHYYIPLLAYSCSHGLINSVSMCRSLLTWYNMTYISIPRCTLLSSHCPRYSMATNSRLLKIIALFCRISSLL